MNRNRPFNGRSFAQYFCIIGMLLFFDLSTIAWAECSQTAKDLINKCRTAKFENDNFTKCAEAKRQCEDSSSNSSASIPFNECSSAISTATSAKSEFNRQCGEAGLGGNCESKLKACDKVGEGDEYISDDDFLRALGQQLGATANMSSKCPKYSGQGFFERKDKYEKDLDDLNNKLSDLKEDNAKIEEEFSKEMKDIQEDLQTAQDDLKKKDLEISKSQRERAAAQAKTAAEVAAEIRKKQTDVLQLRTQIAETYRSKNSSLIVMTENAAKRACMTKVRELRKTYEGIKGGSLRGGLAAAASKKKELNDTFNECMSQFDVQRGALITQTEEKVQAIQMQINNNESDIDNANTQLASMTAQEQQEKNDEATAKANAANSYQEKLKREMARMQSAADVAKKKSDALKEKQEYYKKKGVGLSNSLAALGPVPDDETSTAKMSQVQGYYDSYKAAVENVFNATDPQGNQCKYDFRILGKEFESKAKSSTPAKQGKGKK